MEERSELREPGRDILRLKIADSQPVAGRECRTSTPPDRYVTYTFFGAAAAGRPLQYSVPCYLPTRRGIDNRASHSAFRQRDPAAGRDGEEGERGEARSGDDDVAADVLPAEAASQRV